LIGTHPCIVFLKNFCCFGFLQDICESVRKIAPVTAVLEYSPFFNARNNDVVEAFRSLAAIVSAGEAGGRVSIRDFHGMLGGE